MPGGAARGSVGQGAPLDFVDQDSGQGAQVLPLSFVDEGQQGNLPPWLSRVVRAVDPALGPRDGFVPPGLAWFALHAQPAGRLELPGATRDVVQVHGPHTLVVPKDPKGAQGNVGPMQPLRVQRRVGQVQGRVPSERLQVRAEFVGLFRQGQDAARPGRHDQVVR